MNSSSPNTRSKTATRSTWSSQLHALLLSPAILRLAPVNLPPTHQLQLPRVRVVVVVVAAERLLQHKAFLAISALASSSQTTRLLL